MSRKHQLKELHDMAELAAVDEAINKADSEWCSSLEALGLESEMKKIIYCDGENHHYCKDCYKHLIK